MSDTPPPSDVLDVFVVVHGMGEQVPGNTVADLMQTFVAASDAHHGPVRPLPVSRAFIVSRQEEQGFVMGSEIPDCENPLAGTAFAEVYWSDITSNEFKKTGVAFAKWSASLIRQLELRRDADNPKVAAMIREREWLFPLLRVARGALNNINYLLRPRLGWVSDLAFNKYFGDVQMYAESPETRHQSRARFHDTLNKLHAGVNSRFPNCNCRYHIVAHSLGTVLTLDALLAAHVSSNVQDALGSERQRCKAEGFGTTLSTELPTQTRKLAMFGQAMGLDDVEKADSEAHAFPWISRVQTLVTLGSPIDKFLVLWDRNVRELTEDLDPNQLFHRDGKRIRHFNFCDEQDPFGHRLNVMYETEGNAPSPIAPIAERIFEQCDDFVFSRYPQPLAAHTKYFGDVELVRRIRDEARTGVQAPIDHEFLFRGKTFFRALGWNYFWVQTLTMLLLVISLTAMSTAVDWKTRLLLAVPTAWSFWMILPEFLWLIAAWRILVVGIRKPEEHNERKWIQRFAMISSLLVDGLFVLSFPVTVALALSDPKTPSGSGFWMAIGTMFAVILVGWKVVNLIARRSSRFHHPPAYSRILWFGMTFCLTLLIGFWRELPMFAGNPIDDWMRSALKGLAPIVRTLQPLITHDRAYDFLIPISGAVGIAGTFDILIRAAAIGFLRIKGGRLGEP